LVRSIYQEREGHFALQTTGRSLDPQTVAARARVKNRLSESEERELIRRAKAGDDGARNRLWEAFFSFAVAECRKQAELTELDADIAEGEAALAIPEAISRFDLRRHTRFSTYLAHRLRGAVTAARREHRRASIFDKAEFFPDKPEPPAELSEIRPRPAGDFWSPQVIRWARRRRRRNDRLIVKWLWLDRQPKTQAEVARRLGISRSAVCQRRRILMTAIRQIAPATIFDQQLTREPLNTEEDDLYVNI
jgi:DNA-directed RNA polymerase sigma subunit (sigma70/sigma32)